MPAAEQTFEHGLMYWWSGTQQIYVLMNGGSWSRYPNTWHEGEELIAVTPPAGLYAPERGFGKVWRLYPEVQDSIGWGTRPEKELQGATSGVYQRFEHGTMLYSWAINGHGRRIYVLYAGGAYSIFDDPTG
jgi:hypothetical protein